MRKLFILLLAASLGLTFSSAHAARRARVKKPSVEKRVSALEKQQKQIMALQAHDSKVLSDMAQRNKGGSEGSFVAPAYSYP